MLFISCTSSGSVIVTISHWPTNAHDTLAHSQIVLVHQTGHETRQQRNNNVEQGKEM